MLVEGSILLFLMSMIQLIPLDPLNPNPHLLVLLVPGVEGLLGIILVLEDTQQVAIAKGIDGLKETENASYYIYIKCTIMQL